MEHRKELLRSRIAQIQDPIQKRLLQDVLVDVFGELLDYTGESFARLEKKIDAERSDPDVNYAIHTGVCKKDGLDNASRSLFEIRTNAEQTAGYLGTLFLACDYPTIRGCLKRTFCAKVETGLGEYQTTVSLSYCLAYQEAFHWLYRQFMANGRQWHTINCPFMYKMLDITDREGIVPQEAVIFKVGIDLGELSDFVMDDMALVWNVSEEVCRPRVDVSVAGNVSYYVHRIPWEDSGTGCLAVPEREEMFSVIFSEHELLVRTRQQAHPQLKLLHIEPMREEKDHTALTYAVQTNRRQLRHADRQAAGQPRYLWTKGEVVRILSSYETFRDFELIDICPDRAGEMEAVPMNPFLKVQSLLKQKRKLAVILHAKDSTDIFRYEKMYFLLAELQLCTEEYEWTGILQ